jgi:biopolymer transport protein ExbB
MWRIAASGFTGRTVKPQRLASFGENVIKPVISRRGQRLTYTHLLFHSNIWRIAAPTLDGSPSARNGNSAVPFTSSTRDDSSPQFSPDGKRIAFVSARSGNLEIWVCNSDGSSSVQLTSFRGPAVTTPRWSPDGQFLVFYEDSSQLTQIRADGTGRQQLVTSSQTGGGLIESTPAWSPDGQWIAFPSYRKVSAAKAVSDIFRSRPDGSGLTNVTKTDRLYEGTPAWNPKWVNDLGAALHAESTGTGSTADGLSLSQVDSLFPEALDRWQASGVDISAMDGIDVRIADLSALTLGLASGNTIWLDDNAAGWGWFIDSTPQSDSEFTTPGNQGEQNHMDLLTVVMHELGHLLGYAHEDRGVMSETLAAGIRHRNPAATLAMEAAARAEIARLRRFLPVLDTIITLSPLLGLLGTVTGMIGAFGVMGQSGLNSAVAITGGVGEALIATAVGLGVAIAALVPFNFFNSRAEEMLDTIERYGSRLELLLAEAAAHPLGATGP